MTDAELIAAITEASVLHGNFTLRSGRTSTYYVDKYGFLTQPKVLAEIGKRLAVHVGDADLIAGAEVGGIPLAAAASMACGKPFLIVRNSKKDYGTAKQLEGKFTPGQRVVLVEDVLTTGGQVIEAAGILKDVGLTVDRIVGVIDRQEDARANIEGAGYEFAAIVRVEQLLKK